MIELRQVDSWFLKGFDGARKVLAKANVPMVGFNLNKAASICVPKKKVIHCDALMAEIVLNMSEIVLRRAHQFKVMHPEDHEILKNYAHLFGDCDEFSKRSD